MEIPIVWVIALSLLGIKPSTGAYNYATETALRASILGSYDRHARPDVMVNVTASLSLFSVLSLDINDEAFQFAGYFSFEWTDARLSWSSNAAYNDVPVFYTTDDVIWVPTIIVENSLSSIGIMHDAITPIRVKNDGTVQWEYANIFKISCNIDVSYYPFDTQVCDVTITTWGYTDNDISISFDSTPVTMDYYSPNGEWDYIGYDTSETTSTRFGSSHSMKSFRLKWRRKPEFHILNTLVPVLLFGYLNGIIFKMPADCGEKVGFVLTILLAYAVYLTMISTAIPTTSMNTCTLSVFLIIVLILSIMSVVSTCVSLVLYFRDEDLVPMTSNGKKFWMFLGRLFKWRHLGKCCCKSEKINQSPAEPPGLIQVGGEDVTSVPNGKHHTVTVESEKMISWKNASEILDHCSFVVYYLLLIILTVVTLLTLVVAYALKLNAYL